MATAAEMVKNGINNKSQYKAFIDLFTKGANGSEFTAAELNSIYKTSFIPKIEALFEIYVGLQKFEEKITNQRSLESLKNVYVQSWVKQSPKEGIDKFTSTFKSNLLYQYLNADGSPRRVGGSRTLRTIVNDYFKDLIKKSLNENNPDVNPLEALTGTGDFRDAGDLEKAAKANKSQ